MNPSLRARGSRGWTFVLAALVALAAAEGTSRADSTSGLGLVVYGSDRFQYGRGWERIVGRYDGRYLGSSLRSFRPGARATLDFRGSGIRLYGVMGRGGGLGMIAIDGRIADVVNFFASRKVPHGIVYASPKLARGLHRVVIEVVRPSLDPKAKLGYVNIESAIVTP